MKVQTTLALSLITATCFGQYQPIVSNVYAWNDLAVTKTANAEQRQILEGTTPAFKHLKVHATTLNAHQKPHPSHRHDDEELIIVKEGELTVTIEGKTETLEAGSIALIMPGDEHGFENKGDSKASYYVMRYESVEPVDIERGKKAGGSQMVHWKDVAFNPHDKGGRRNFIDRPTAHSKRFEMHVTTLNGKFMSHPPHTHKAAEILILTENKAEETIDGQWYKSDIGDVVFLQSNVPHALKNDSQKSCTYFAFQFE